MSAAGTPASSPARQRRHDLLVGGAVLARGEQHRPDEPPPHLRVGGGDHAALADVNERVARGPHHDLAGQPREVQRLRKHREVPGRDVVGAGPLPDLDAAHSGPSVRPVEQHLDVRAHPAADIHGGAQLAAQRTDELARLVVERREAWVQSVRRVPPVATSHEENLVGT